MHEVIGWQLVEGRFMVSQNISISSTFLGSTGYDIHIRKGVSLFTRGFLEPYVCLHFEPEVCKESFFCFVFSSVYDIKAST